MKSRNILLNQTPTASICLGLILCVSACWMAGCKDTKVDPSPEDPPGSTPGDEGCERHTDCGLTEFCEEGECVDAPSCANTGAWARCANDADKLEPDSGYRYVCRDKQCTRLCIEDSDCEGDDTICSDFGVCIQYDGELMPYDNGSTQASALKAGVGEVLIHAPVGVEMGGYGGRASPNDGRYAVSLRASQGQMDAQYVRAVLLQNEDSRIMMMRLPAVFAFSNIRERVARNLQAATGQNWRDAIIYNTTHTHSGPTGFWRFPRDVVLDPGMLGAGYFNQNIEDWFVESMTEAALQAIDNAQPAKLGWAITNGFDPENELARDRWGSTPIFEMQRMLLMRVDYAEGANKDEPMAILFSYASHATSNGSSSDYLTNDVIGGAEFGLSEALYRTYGRHIPAAFFQEAAGSMSPQASSQGHSFPYSRERAGYKFAQIAMPVIEALNGASMKQDVVLRAKTYRFNLNYHAMNYEPEEFYTDMDRPLGGTLYSGALECTGPNAKDDDYMSYIPPEELSCVGNVALIIKNAQPTPLTRSQITALELDGLHAVTMPGEPTQEIGWEILRGLRDNFDVPTSSSWVFGYTNDHLLYMTPTNLRGEAPDFQGFKLENEFDDSVTWTSFDDTPDYAFSYLQGGYEMGMTPWGWKSGDFLVARAMDAWAWFQDDSKVPSVMPPILPTQYTRVDDPPYDRDATPADRIGKVLDPEIDGYTIGAEGDAMPDPLERMTPVYFRWVGGDMGAESPQSPEVSLEVQTGNGDWEKVIGRDGLPINNRGLAMATHLQIVDEDSDAPEYVWNILYEPTQDIPEGTYRLHVEGHYYEDQNKDRTAYTVNSASFDIVASTKLQVKLAYDTDEQQLEIHPFYPAMVPLVEKYNDERARVHGSLRLRDPRVPTGSLASVSTYENRLLDGDYVTEDSVSFAGAGLQDTCASLSDTDGHCTIDSYEEKLPGAKFPSPRTVVYLKLADGSEPAAGLEVTVQDQYGNTGVATWAP